MTTLVRPFLKETLMRLLSPPPPAGDPERLSYASQSEAMLSSQNEAAAAAAETLADYAVQIVHVRSTKELEVSDGENSVAVRLSNPEVVKELARFYGLELKRWVGTILFLRRWRFEAAKVVHVRRDDANNVLEPKTVLFLTVDSLVPVGAEGCGPIGNAVPLATDRQVAARLRVCTETELRHLLTGRRHVSNVATSSSSSSSSSTTTTTTSGTSATTVVASGMSTTANTAAGTSGTVGSNKQQHWMPLMDLAAAAKEAAAAAEMTAKKFGVSFANGGAPIFPTEPGSVPPPLHESSISPSRGINVVAKSGTTASSSSDDDENDDDDAESTSSLHKHFHAQFGTVARTTLTSPASAARNDERTKPATPASSRSPVAPSSASKKAVVVAATGTPGSVRSPQMASSSSSSSAKSPPVPSSVSKAATTVTPKSASAAAAATSTTSTPHSRAKEMSPLASPASPTRMKGAKPGKIAAMPVTQVASPRSSASSSEAEEEEEEQQRENAKDFIVVNHETRSSPQRRFDNQGTEGEESAKHEESSDESEEEEAEAEKPRALYKVQFLNNPGMRFDSRLLVTHVDDFGEAFKLRVCVGDTILWAVSPANATHARVVEALGNRSARPVLVQFRRGPEGARRAAAASTSSSKSNQKQLASPLGKKRLSVAGEEVGRISERFSADGDPYIGHEVVTTFGNMKYRGVVLGRAEEEEDTERYYAVRYLDGTSDRVKESELRSMIAAATAMANHVGEEDVVTISTKKKKKSGASPSSHDRRLVDRNEIDILDDDEDERGKKASGSRAPPPRRPADADDEAEDPTLHHHRDDEEEKHDLPASPHSPLSSPVVSKRRRVSRSHLVDSDDEETLRMFTSKRG